MAYISEQKFGKQNIEIYMLQIKFDIDQCTHYNTYIFYNNIKYILIFAINIQMTKLLSISLKIQYWTLAATYKLFNKRLKY